MSAETVLKLVLAALPLVMTAAGYAWLIRGHGRQGGRFDWARRRFAVVEVDGDADRARELVFAGLEEVLGTRAGRRGADRFRVFSHLDGGEAATHALEFAVVPAARTRVTVTSLPRNAFALGMHPDETRNRLDQLERLAAWLADRGGGRVLDTGWGKP